MNSIKMKLNNAEQNQEDIYVLKHEFLNYLKKKAYKSKKKVYRYCVHKSNDHLTQEMIIVFHKDTIVTPHRHPRGRSESYHVIEGAMNVYFFNDEGKAINAIKLEEQSRKNFFYYRLSSHTWHMPMPTTEFMIYHETITGPFVDREKDIEYPSWKQRYNNKDKIKKLTEEFPIKSNKIMHNFGKNFIQHKKSKSLSYFPKNSSKLRLNQKKIINFGKDFIQDKKSKSLSYFPKKNSGLTLNKKLISRIKKIAFKTKKNIRISLHRSPNEEFHNIIIFHWNSTYYKPHKHLYKEETCHMIEGSQRVITLDSHAKIIADHKLNSKNNLIFKIKKNTIHTAVILSKYVIFHESKPGPYLGDKDSIFPKWAPKEDDHKGIKKFFKNLK